MKTLSISLHRRGEMHFQLLGGKNQRRENFKTFFLTNIMNDKKESENRNMINMSDKAYHPKK